VIGNTANINGGVGLEINPGGIGYVNNVLNGNNGGDANPQVEGGGVEMGQNVCGGDTNCP
jgi:hypothetical protein